MVARFVRDEEAVGSNPATPTVNRRDRLVPAILYVYSQTDCQHGRKGGNEAGAGGRALLRHAGGCGTRGRQQGTPSTCGQLRCPRAAAGHSFGMRAAAVLKGGSRALLRHAGGCGTQGRRQGLAGLRADAPSRRLAARTASGRAAAQQHTQRLSPEAGASGARNVSGPTRNAGNPATHSTGARTRRPAPLDATTQTQLRSTCVRCRSAHAAHQSRRSSRSPRLRRRAGPRR